MWCDLFNLTPLILVRTRQIKILYHRTHTSVSCGLVVRRQRSVGRSISREPSLPALDDDEDQRRRSPRSHGTGELGRCKNSRQSPQHTVKLIN